jgi:hypothetical protein
MNTPTRASLFLHLVLLASIGAWQNTKADTTILVPSADASLRDNSPDMNFGESNPLIVGNSKEPFTVHNRALLKFDLTGIPTTATITGVSLVVAIFRSNTDNSDYDLNRVLVDWSELGATWNYRTASQPWLAGGGQGGSDFVAAASVTATVDDTIFSSAGMIADVQLWVRNPGTNYGWIMLPTGNLPGTGKQLGSRESEYTPILTVNYTLSAPVTPLALFGVALVGNEFRFSFNAESNRVYAVEFCDTMSASGWNPLTNIPAQPVGGLINITNAVSSTALYFRVRAP